MNYHKTVCRPSYIDLKPLLRNVIQCKCACGQHNVAGDECVECNKKRMKLHHHSVNQAEPTSAPPIVHEVLRSPGQSLDPATRAFMELRFDHDFSRVWVHTDAMAAESARAVNALAYTVGNHIAFDQGNYAPGTETGKRLLTHELAHVIQQNSAPAITQIPIDPANSTVERQAAAAVNHTHPLLSPTKFSIQRQQSQPQYRQVPGITTPQQTNVQINRSGITTQTIHGLKVIFQPDHQSKARNMRNRAETTYNFDRYKINYRTRKGAVNSFTGPGQPSVRISTTYGQGVTSASISGYGRGTTQADMRAGYISVGFHEGRHGLDYLTYFQQNPFPQFKGRVGMSEAVFRAAVQNYHTARQRFTQNLGRFSEQRTDCVGMTIDKFNANQGINTTVCQVTP